MEHQFDAYILKFTFDTIVPIDNGVYPVDRDNVKKLYISVENEFKAVEDVGSFVAHGEIHLNSGHQQGKSQIQLTYVCNERVNATEFSEILNISSIWHLSATGWDFALRDLNRIIDLYRYLGESYWWQHLTMWNVDELTIHGGLNNGDEIISISQQGSAKIISSGDKPLNQCAYELSSKYYEYICNGKSLPFYFVLYLNGRRSFAEHSYREAIVNWANCIEAFAIYLLEAALRKANKGEENSLKVLKEADSYQKRYSKAYEILAPVKIHPSLKKKKALKHVSEAMKFRNYVMHGRDPELNWGVIGDKHSSVKEVLNIAHELSL